MKDFATKKTETRIVPEETPAKFLAEHLKAYEFAEDFVKGKKVLEVGCGDGYGSAYLAKAASEVVGVDYEKNVIVSAQRKYARRNLIFLCADATHLEFKDNSFDVVCSFQVIEHIPEDKLIHYLLEIRRVLKSDGAFYLSTLNLEHARKSALTYQKNSAHCKEFELESLKDLLSQAFDKVEILGLHLTLKHRLYLRLKKSGIFRFLPDARNPVSRFYNQVTTDDFEINNINLKKAIDFICICEK